MVASRESTGPRALLAVGVAAALVLLLWAFPLFRVVPLTAPAGGAGVAPGSGEFDAPAAAARIWTTDLPNAARRAVELKTFVRQLRQDPLGAKKAHAKAAGLGTAYFLVRGGGQVVAREGSYLRVALDGTDSATVALCIGPVFGNTVRDGCGLLDVNAYPGLQEFNALAAELNALVEKQVLPVLREKAAVGAQVQFAGCAEAPESAAATGEPVLTIIPVQAEVR